MDKKRAQTALEYIMLIAGAIAFVVIVVVLLNSSIFKPSSGEITNTSGVIASLKANLTG